MNSYTHVATLREPLGELITRALDNYASERKLGFEAWIQGQPIWCVREHDGKISKAQVEAVLRDGRQELSFTPDAYADTEEYIDGVRVTHRRIAAPQAVVKNRHTLDLFEMTQTVIKEADWSKTEELVQQMVDTTLNLARSLDLTEELVIRATSPFPSTTK